MSAPARPHARQELVVPGGQDGVARVQPEVGLVEREARELDRAPRLAHQELRGGGVDRAAWPRAQHPVEAAGRDVGEGDRDGPDHPHAVGRARELVDDGRDPRGLRGFEAHDLEPEAGPSELEPAGSSSQAPSPRLAVNSSPAPNS